MVFMNINTSLLKSKRAESPIFISVGQRPTIRRNKKFKPCKGVIKKMSPLQGLFFSNQFRRALPYAYECQGFALFVPMLSKGIS